MVRPFDEHEKEYPMKLYIYDHCPFCVRARMAAGLFGADVEEVVLANDDEATPIGMIGAKQVPILQKEDGSFMGESLDVVRYLDREGRLKDETRPEIQAWLDKVGEYNLKLVQPRVIKLELPEFETPEAVKYFTDKKEKSIGSFAANLEKTGQYVQRLNGDLAELETLMTEGGAGLNGEIGMEDILVFPILRNLTIVRGVEWPQRAAERVYVDPVIKQYIVALINTSRGGGPRPVPGLDRQVRVGASPRGGIALMKVAQAVALQEGRTYVIPDDVRLLRHGVLRHRLVLTYDALADGVAPEAIIDAIFAAVPTP